MSFYTSAMSPKIIATRYRVKSIQQMQDYNDSFPHTLQQEEVIMRTE